jgi:hypothetical protein
MRLQLTLLLLCAAYLAVDGAWTIQPAQKQQSPPCIPRSHIHMLWCPSEVLMTGHKHVPCAARALHADVNTRNAAFHYYMPSIMFFSRLNESCMPACDSSRSLQNSCLFMCQYRPSTQPQLCSIRRTHNQPKHLLHPCLVSATQQLCHLRNTSLKGLCLPAAALLPCAAACSLLWGQAPD